MGDYCTFAEVKAQMPDVQWGASYDALLGLLIGRASRLLERIAGGWPDYFAASTAGTRYFDGNGERELFVDVLAEAPTSVYVAETGLVDGASGSGGTYTLWPATEYWLWPYNAPQLGQPYRRLDLNVLTGTKLIWYEFPRAIKITGKFGWSTTVPDVIKQATIIQTVRWFKRGQQAFQDVGAITNLGQLQYVKDLDPDVSLILENSWR